MDFPRSADSGFYTRHAAKAWLDNLLAEIRRGEALGLRHTGARLSPICARSTSCTSRPTGRLSRRAARLPLDHAHAHRAGPRAALPVEALSREDMEAWSRDLSATGTSNRTKLKVMTVMRIKLIAPRRKVARR